MQRNLQYYIECFIAESRSDYINLGQVIQAANEATDAAPFLGRLERSLLLVVQMLERGFMAGELVGPTGFTAFLDQSSNVVCRRIEEIWREAGIDDEPYVGFLVWFDRPASRL